MKKYTMPSALEAVVTVGLNCVDQGIDTRENVKAAILGHVERHYLPLDSVATPEVLPVTVLDRLHEALGLAFEAHGGRLVMVSDRAPAARTA